MADKVSANLKNIPWDTKITSDNIIPTLLEEAKLLFLNEIIYKDFYSKEKLKTRYALLLADGNQKYLSSFKIFSSQAIFKISNYVKNNDDSSKGFLFTNNNNTIEIPPKSNILSQIINLMSPMNNYITPFVIKIEDARTYKDILEKYTDIKGNKMTFSPAIDKITKDAIDLCKKAVDDSFRKNNDIKTRYRDSKNDDEKNIVVQEILNKLSEEIRELLKKLEDKNFVNEYSIIHNDEVVKKNILDVIAKSFAWWTAKSSAKNYLEAYVSILELDNKNENSDNFIASMIIKEIKMHQIIAAILLIFSKNNKNTREMLNQIIEVSTGEGKSVIIATFSIALASLGFNVLISNYSNTLAERDSKEFSSLFESLNLGKKIQYGTLDEIVEIIENKNFKIRELVADYLTGKSLDVNSLLTESKYVLVLDEVDTIASKDFGGKTYSPSFIYKNNDFKILLDFIWEEVTKKTYINDILKLISEKEEVPKIVESLIVNKEIATSEYKNEIRTNLMKQISDALYAAHMVHNNLIKKDIDYKIKIQIDENKLEILYKDVDGFVNNIMTYKSIFILKNMITEKTYTEEELPLIESHLEKLEGIILSAGKYSYISSIQKGFKNVVGLSGTIGVLNERQIEVLNSINVKKLSISPSFYKHIKEQKKVKVEKKFIICDDNEDQIQKICEIVKGKIGSGGIVVIVTGEDNLDTVLDAINKANVANLKNLQKLITKSTFLEKEECLRKAGQPYSITIMAEVFNRGTDIVIYDSELAKSEGLTYINTIPLKNKADEIQSNGRAARGDNAGTIINIYTKKEFEETYFISKKKEIIFTDEFLNEIYAKREEKMNSEITKIIESAKGKNDLSLKARELILQNKKENIPCNFIMEDNTVKIFMAVDATSTMGGLLRAVEKSLGETLNKLYAKHEGRCCLKFLFYGGSRYYSEHGFAGKKKEFMIDGHHNWKDENNTLKMTSFLRCNDEFARETKDLCTFGGSSNNEGVLIALFTFCMQNAIDGTSKFMIFGDDYFTTGNDMEEINNNTELKYMINEVDIPFFDEACKKDTNFKTLFVLEKCTENQHSTTNCSGNIIKLKYSKVKKFLKNKKCSINTFMVDGAAVSDITKKVFLRIADDNNGIFSKYERNENQKICSILEDTFGAEIAKG